MRPLKTLLLSWMLVFILGQTSLFAQKSDHKRYVATIKTNRTKITAVIYQITDSSLLIIPEKVLKTLQKSTNGFLSHSDIVPNLNEVLVKNIQQIHIRRSGRKGIKIASIIIGSLAGTTLGIAIAVSNVVKENDFLSLKRTFASMAGAAIGMPAGTLVGYLATTVSLDSFYLEGSAKEFEKEKKNISQYSYKEQFAL